MSRYVLSREQVEMLAKGITIQYDRSSYVPDFVLSSCMKMILDKKLMDGYDVVLIQEFNGAKIDLEEKRRND